MTRDHCPVVSLGLSVVPLSERRGEATRLLGVTVLTPPKGWVRGKPGLRWHLCSLRAYPPLRLRR
eukprot:2440607-Pleurochrysis_carterae.AAC.1